MAYVFHSSCDQLLRQLAELPVAFTVTSHVSSSGNGSFRDIKTEHEKGSTLAGKPPAFGVPRGRVKHVLALELSGLVVPHGSLRTQTAFESVSDYYCGRGQ